MNFGFTEEQDILRDQVRKFLDQESAIPAVRKISATPKGYDTELWQKAAELGWLGLTTPEALGGSGLNWVDLVVLLEEQGRTLHPSPFISNILAVTAICEFGSDEQKQRFIPSLLNGSSIGTLAFLEEDDQLAASAIQFIAHEEGDGFVLDGTKHFVSDAAQATLFVVACRSSKDQSIQLLIAEQGEQISAKNCTTMDSSKREGQVSFDKYYVPVENVLSQVTDGEAAVTRLNDLGAVAVTAEMIGAAEGAMAITNQYAKDRIQFGSQIGRYQGVKHPLAEMYVDIESYKSLLYYAAWTVTESPDELARYASLAKGYASEAFPRIGIDCVQLHGAIGYTAEYDIQLYLKRSKWARPKFGDADFHNDRVATLGGL
jgi:alkylation response protein AidB-like acyl-CoA dehydrogenase